MYETRGTAAGEQFVGEHACCTCRDARFVSRAGAQITDPPAYRYPPCPDCATPANPVTAREQFVRAARIPKIYSTLRLPDFRAPPDQEAKDVAPAYAMTWPSELPFLTLTSPIMGNGKTLLACGILQSAFEHHGICGRFHSVVRLLEEYRRGYAKEQAGEQRIIAALDSSLQLSSAAGARRSGCRAQQRLDA